MCTMADTLILAYMSGAICLILGFVANNSLFVDIINQDMSNNAILIEVGADINTTTEADATGKYIARLLAEYLNKTK